MSAVLGSAEVATPPRRNGREQLLPVRALGHVLVLAGIVSAAAFSLAFFPLGGTRYYTTPLRSRGTVAAHRVLRPSGPVGNALGVAGTALMLGTLAYVARKHSRWLATAGSPKAWLEVHIFCGIVGPAFITLHSAFKFGGLIAIAYWSMVLVVLSGFVGRYLYVRIPKTLRGTELSIADVEARAAEAKAQLLASAVPARLLAEVAAAEAELLPPPGTRMGYREALLGDLRVHARLRRLRRAVADSGVDPTLLHELMDLVSERIDLLRRAAALSRTKRLFDLWHVFHRPLVWVLFGVVVLHVGLALYMGYTVFGR